MTNFKFAGVSAAALALGIAAPALAQEDDKTGVYVEGNVGVTSVDDIDITYFDEGGTFGGTGASDSVSFRGETRSAVALGGAIGYDFGLIRTDIRVDYARNRISGLTIRQVNGADVTLSEIDSDGICDFLETDDCAVSGNTISGNVGRVRTLSALANVWVDIPTGSAVTPYVGGGVGIGGYEVDGEGKSRFAWQVGAGVAYNISPTVALLADYRYRQIGGSTIEDDEFPGAGVRIGQVKTSSFTAGLRFTF